MKKYFFLLAALSLSVLSCFSQSIAINDDGSLANPHAIVDIKSSTKGVMIPRMSTAARLAIPNTRGLLVFDTTTNLVWYNTGMAWQSMSADIASGNGWSLTGNSNTQDKVNYLGTTNNVPLNIRVNNQPSGRIDPIRNNAYWGYEAGKSDSIGSNNTADGFQALYSNKTGFSNVALGVGAMFSSSSTRNTIAIGDSALYHCVNTPGEVSDAVPNAAVGSKALYSNTSGYSNTAIGYQALFSNTGGSQNAAIGNQALFSNTGGNLNLAVGFETLFSNTTGGQNTAVGCSALYYNTTGFNNTATGTGALSYNTTGFYNTSDGFLNLSNNSSGHDNTSSGYTALSTSSTGSFNTANGSQSLLYNTTGDYNTANGFRALEYNTFGNWNTANGATALQYGSGYSNTADGYGALGAQTTGSNNTADGANTLLSNLTGTNLTAIGISADVAVDGLFNATAIGNEAKVDANNKVRIGNPSVTVIEGQVPFTTPSDGRFKFNIQENVKGLDFVLKLRPVTYQFDVKKQDDFTRGVIKPDQLSTYITSAGNDDATQMIRTGFIAQEVEQAAKKSGYTFDGVKAPKTEREYYSLSYSSFVVPLVKAVQEQQEIIQAQNLRISNLEQEIADIKKLVLVSH